MRNSSGSANIIELRGVTQKYKGKKGEDKVIFQDFNFYIEDKPDKGQFVALMGESGCGKSTILNYVTGLSKPTSGEIYFHDRLLQSTDIIPMVFQQNSSPQWFTVLDNVALPLYLKGIKGSAAHDQAMAMIKVVGLEGHEKKYTKSPDLSGGQLQRVAIARSLVANPTMIMMDEPFSALDSVTRKKMQDFIKKLFTDSELSDLNPTFVLVTHDEREAAYLASDIIVMGSNPGHIKAHIQPTYSNVDIKKDSVFFETVTYLESII